MPLQEIVTHVLAELRSAWRFRWFGALVSWIVFLAGWVWVGLQPSVYEANARVYVDSTSVLRPILNDRIVPADFATQLAYVRQSLLGRAHLERVARENALDVQATTQAQREQILDDLRTTIAISNRDATNTVYSIRYRHSDRAKAIGVVTTLLNSLVEDTLGASQRGTDTASRFLDERIVEYENRLQQAEQALAEFKKRNADRLPGAEGGFFQRMRAENDALEATRKDLRLATSRRDQLRTQLNSESPVMPAGTAAGTEPPPNSLDARIRDHRAELDRLLLQYTDRHPDVVATREALSRLEGQRAEQLRALGATDLDQEISRLDSNPVYQALRIALNETEVEIASLEADVRERTEKLNALQALVDEIPDVEAELARLNRDYDVIYEQYQGMVRSRETQDLTQKASSADDVQFRVIDPPIADFKPVAPDRFLLLAAAFVVSLGLGGGLCWLLSQLRPVFTSTASLREVCGLPVLGAVSQAASPQLKIRRRFELLGFAGAMSCLVALFGFAVMIEVSGGGIRALAGMA